MVDRHRYRPVQEHLNVDQSLEASYASLNVLPPKQLVERVLTDYKWKMASKRTHFKSPARNETASAEGGHGLGHGSVTVLVLDASLS